MKFDFKKLLPHLIAIVLFCIASAVYFYPVLQGKKMLQSDIVQYVGMAKQQNDFRAETGEEPYYTDSSFIGMPTYQMGANYPHNYVKKLDSVLRFLPRPADYLFLYFISFYILMLVLRVETKFAFLGSLAFGLSTYYIIILGVGHNAKAHAIAYFPMVLAGILLTFQKRYIYGALLTTLGLALQIGANHFQMTYYLLILVIVMGIVLLIDAYRKQELLHFMKAMAFLVPAALLALLLNATNLMATQEYAKDSIRSKTDISIHPDGTEKEVLDGLSPDYITEYSYGVLESFDLLIPRFMGGSGGEDLGGKDSELYKSLGALNPDEANFVYRNSSAYWGEQPIVAAPAYLGAVVVFLFVLALFLVKGRFRVWVLAGIVLTLMLSWGKNFSALTNFFIEYVPMYDKFRAVSSIQVIIEFVVPMMAILGLVRFVSKVEDKERKMKALKYTTFIIGGLCLFFLLLGTSIFDFQSSLDPFKEYPEIMNPLMEDRKTLFVNDTLRTLVFVLITAFALYMHTRDKLKENVLLIVIGLAMVIDLAGVNHRYVNADNFVHARKLNKPFQQSAADISILKDTTHYRVYDKAQIMRAKPSYFHNALGGYSAVRPRRFQELYDFYLSESDSLNIGNRKSIPAILNMLNVKYIIDGGAALVNPYANGNAWFVKDVKTVSLSNEEILALKEIAVKDQAVVNTEIYSNIKATYAKDSLSTISLVEHQPNYLKYKTENAGDGLAVFSEMHYEKGWKAFIDGKPKPYVRANFLLRGLEVPSGKHVVEFKFDPQVVKTGSKIALIASIVFVLLIALGVYWIEFKTVKKEVSS
ncbi:MAG: YfhO family protein [Flavobacteriaceae bacterium]|nr:YfhO family protein [Flavobacteriaceae bacterium]